MAMGDLSGQAELQGVRSRRVLQGPGQAQPRRPCGSTRFGECPGVAKDRPLRSAVGPDCGWWGWCRLFVCPCLIGARAAKHWFPRECGAAAGTQGAAQGAVAEPDSVVGPWWAWRGRDAVCGECGGRGGAGGAPELLRPAGQVRGGPWCVQ